eukprot:CAMPEP_0183342768 /NCGR_PEP_ID=MMETSP0164_2-20130417/8825_1 /TAXON_ID=221442 /ORGANISM="Coccolithus pelagicus ssp braarudi, Strain PLY182g" /LENGTH=187 /DNA_ID=CAMNT_0025513457 /DNA_START=239 /DNA_END=798 /DNA_ORIENTATION=-
MNSAEGPHAHALSEVGLAGLANTRCRPAAEAEGGTGCGRARWRNHACEGAAYIVTDLGGALGLRGLLQQLSPCLRVWVDQLSCLLSLSRQAALQRAEPGLALGQRQGPAGREVQRELRLAVAMRLVPEGLDLLGQPVWPLAARDDGPPGVAGVDVDETFRVGPHERLQLLLRGNPGDALEAQALTGR